MIECPYKHLLKPSLYNNTRVAQFLDALDQPEVDEASGHALLYFVDHTPSLDDILSHLYTTEDQATNAMKQGILRPFFAIFSPQGQITYQIRKITDRRIHTKCATDELITTCKAITFVTKAYCTFMVYYEEILDRIQVIGSSIRGNKITSAIDVVYSDSGIKFSVHRDIGHKVKIPAQCRFYEVEGSSEMLAILQKVQSINQVEGITNLPQLSEYDILLNFAVVMKAIGAFRG